MIFVGMKNNLASMVWSIGVGIIADLGNDNDVGISSNNSQKKNRDKRVKQSFGHMINLWFLDINESIILFIVMISHLTPFYKVVCEWMQHKV